MTGGTRAASTLAGMRRRLAPAIPILLASLGWVAAGGPAAAAAPYSIEILRPAGRDGTAAVRGIVRIVAEAAGLGRPSDVAFAVADPEDGWDDGAATPLTSEGEGRWTGPLDTRELPNGRYRLSVRAWGGPAGAYDPNDPSTFASAELVLEVANPPPAPTGLSVQGGGASFALAWSEVAGADRPDFAGYEVLLALADGPCPPMGAAYTVRATTYATAHVVADLEPGRYCGAVRAARTSPGAGRIASAATPPLGARVEEGEAPPATPDGEYSTGLPYEARTEVSPIPVSGERALEAGHDEGRGRWTWMAGGLAVAVLGLLSLRYVGSAPRD